MTELLLKIIAVELAIIIWMMSKPYREKKAQERQARYTRKMLKYPLQPEDK